LEVIGGRRKSLGERIVELFVKEVALEVNRPPLFEMLGGSLPARATPYGHRPDKMARDFELWRGAVEADARRIAQNMRRRRATRGSLGIFGRSIGSHEMACAYGQWLLKSELRPNYVVSILPVFAEEREELIAYISLVKEFGVPRNELLVPYTPRASEFGSLAKSDVAFLTTFLLNAMCSNRPDIITLVEKARQRSPFAGIIMKRELIPIRYIKTSTELISVIRIPGPVVARPDSNYELTVETLISDLHLEMTLLNATPVAIFLHGPFTEEEARELEEGYSRQYPVVVGYGGSGGEGDFAEVYGVGVYVLNDPKALPPELAKIIGVSHIDEVKLESSKSCMEEGYEILSKFCGVDVGELFRRGEEK
jgi:hypothetical protein